MRKLTVLVLFLCFIFPSISYSQLETTVDISHYKYEEEVNGAFFMSDESDPLFLSVGIRDWKKGLIEPTELMYTAELTYGQTEYNSASTGTLIKDYYKARFETLLSYNYEGVSPFLGLGYRWLYDDSGGLVSSTGHTGYDRQSQYLYLPLGIITQLTDELTFKGQYNLFLSGKQTSYLSTFSASCGDVENNQNDGYGFDSALNYSLDEDISIYGFYRYWDIADSDPNTVVCAGSILTAKEPKNTTAETGIGIAFRW